MMLSRRTGTWFHFCCPGLRAVSPVHDGGQPFISSGRKSGGSLRPSRDFGHEIDDQFTRTFVITGIVFVAAQFGLAYAIFKFRDQGQKATYFEGNNTMEIIWTLATVVLFVGLGLYARNAWAEVHFMGAAPGALQVEVTGQQFVWNFRYAGPDGKFGRDKPELVSASTGNPVGLDPADPASKDDIVSPVIVVPARSRSRADHPLAGRHPQLLRARIAAEAGRRAGHGNSYAF